MDFVLFFLSISAIIVQVLAAPTKWIDLSYQFAVNETLYWPGSKPFEHELVYRGNFTPTTFATWSNYAAAEHGGTHMDAPIHFNINGIPLEKVAIETVVGDAIVVNVTAKAQKNPDAELEISDLEAWEKQHGRIPDKSIVFMYSGNGRYWPDNQKYFGSNTPENHSTLHFPGLHHKAAKWLIDNRKMKLFGLDTPSFDRGNATDPLTHKVLLGRNVPGIENLANLHLLPPKGFEVFAAPMKIKDGSGGPVRVIARITADQKVVNMGIPTTKMSSAVVISTIVAVFLLM